MAGAPERGIGRLKCGAGGALLEPGAEALAEGVEAEIPDQFFHTHLPPFPSYAGRGARVGGQR